MQRAAYRKTVKRSLIRNFPLEAIQSRSKVALITARSRDWLANPLQIFSARFSAPFRQRSQYILRRLFRRKILIGGANRMTFSGVVTVHLD